MGNVLALDALLESRQVWRGQPAPREPSKQPTGFAALDDALPGGGWPDNALTELLLPADGVGELRLLWPTLARLSRSDGMVVLIAPPYLPFAPAWAQAGVQLSRLQVIRADARNALWAAEQCLRSAACSAVLCWPQQADDRALRRLQVAAESGQCLGFAMRPMKAAANPSPAALRIAVEAEPAQLRVLKCRGGNPPSRPIAFPPTGRGSTRSPMTIGQGVADEGIAEKPAMGECRPACATLPRGLPERPPCDAGPDRKAGRRPASGQEALMKGRSTALTAPPLRDQAAPAPTLAPATIPFRPHLLPTQAQ